MDQEIEDILLGHEDRRPEGSLNQRIAAALAAAKGNSHPSTPMDEKQPSTEAVEVAEAFLFPPPSSGLSAALITTTRLALALDAFAARRAAEAVREGHNGRCYYCGEPCNDLAGDPGEWSIGLSHPDEEPGFVKYHHTRCIFVRLHPDPLTAAEDKARRSAIEECARWLAPNFPGQARDMIRALTDKPAAGKDEP